MPPLADAYFSRTETGPALASRLQPGDTVALVDGGETGSASAAHGGTGKTQLAVAFTHVMWQSRAVEILVWVNAASRESVVAGFAQAASLVDAGHPDEDARSAAARFVSWLAGTRRGWALILDDLAEVADLDELWPAGPCGRIVITTRLPAASFGRRDMAVIPVTGLSRRESLSYLGARLTGVPDQRIEALDLGVDLDGLPLALAQAGAVLHARGLGCREYRAQLAERRRHLPAVPGVPAAVLATWSLAAECADQLPPAGLAWPALVLAAMGDHHGVPGAVLTSPAACSYIAGHPSTAGRTDQVRVRAAINNLAQAGLVAIDQVSPARTVQMHACVQAAVRAYLPRRDLEQAVRAVADALVEAWPEDDDEPGPDQAQLDQAQLDQAQLDQAQLDQAQLDQALRDCATTLRAHDGGALWQPQAHPVLFRAGRSLERSRLADAAIAHWKAMLAMSTRLLGPAHADTVAARERLAAAYESAGKAADAVTVHQDALADREQDSGPGHAETAAARGRLAQAYATAGRHAEAVTLYERAVADSRQRLGPAHPVTLAARSGLGAAYAANGQATEAIGEYKRTLADRERVQGASHRDVIATRAHLAAAYRGAGRLKDAIRQYERALADSERMLGAGDEETLAARCHLAAAYDTAGRHTDAVMVLRKALLDCEKYLGPNHQLTQTIRANLDAGPPA